MLSLDDNWERCYGDAVFDESSGKFPDPKGLVKKIKEELGYRVTLWIHPFVNLECLTWMDSISPPSSVPFVRDKKGKEGIGNLPGLTWWWQGKLPPPYGRYLIALCLANSAALGSTKTKTQSY